MCGLSVLPKNLKRHVQSHPKTFPPGRVKKYKLTLLCLCLPFVFLFLLLLNDILWVQSSYQTVQKHLSRAHRMAELTKKKFSEFWEKAQIQCWMDAQIFSSDYCVGNSLVVPSSPDNSSFSSWNSCICSH